MKQFCYYATMLALSTVLLVSGNARGLFCALLPLSWLVSMGIAMMFACRSDRPVWLTSIIGIAMMLLGPFVCIGIYHHFWTGNFHVGNILMVAVFVVLRYLLKPPAQFMRQSKPN